MANVVGPDQTAALGAVLHVVMSIWSPAAWPPGPGCSKLTTSLVNVSLKFQTVISQISEYFC